MSRHLPILAALGLAAASLATPALAAPPPTDTCFWSADWQGWSSPRPDVILLHVGASQVFELDLKNGSDQLKYPDMHLFNQGQHGTWICTPNDLHLMLSDDHHIYSEPLFVKSITRLTPEQIEAIPAKYRP